MAKVINSSRFNFEDVVGDMLRGYEADCIRAVSKAVPKVARMAAKKLRQESPGHGDYAKNWTTKIETGRMNVGAVVYGKSPTYRIAHLLENSHAKRGGGRTSPGNGQIIHIKPVADWATEQAYTQIQIELSAGGKE